MQDSVHKNFFRLPDRNATKPRLPQIGTFLNLDGQAMISAWKWSEDGQGAMLRLFNVEEHASLVKLDGVTLSGEVLVTNLLEEPISRITANDQVVEFELGAKKIATYRL